MSELEKPEDLRHEDGGKGLTDKPLARCDRGRIFISGMIAGSGLVLLLNAIFGVK